MNKLKVLGKYSAAITFLAYEFFALIAFNFSGSFVLFGSLSLGLCLLLVLFNIGEIKSKGLSNVALFFIPLFLFTLLTALGTYSRAHIFYGNFSLADVIFIPLGLMPMAFVGYLLSIDKNFKIKTFITVIFSALAVYVLINFIYNLISFGAFYTVIYKGYYLYYSGIRSEIPVNEFAYVLEGFKFIEVKMSHYVLYPLLLLTSSVMLLFTSPKKERGYFLTYLLFTILAIFALTFIPSILSIGGIIFVAVLLLLIYLAKTYIKSRKAFKFILIIGLALVGLFYLFYVIVAATGVNASFNGILGKIFYSNRYSRLVNPILINLFTGNKFLGFFSNPIPYSDYFDVIHLSGFFIFDTFMTSGVIGALVIFLFIFLGFKSFKKYFYSHKDEFRFSATLLLFAVVFISYSAFFNEGEYAIYYNFHKPLYLTSSFMIFTFIMSYVICKPRVDIVPIKKEEAKEVEANA